MVSLSSAGSGSGSGRFGWIPVRLSLFPHSHIHRVRFLVGDSPAIHAFVKLRGGISVSTPRPDVAPPVILPPFPISVFIRLPLHKKRIAPRLELLLLNNIWYN